MYAVYVAIDDALVKEQLLAYVTTLKRIKPTVSGDDLRARGLPPGPQYRRILDELTESLARWESKQPEAELELLEKLIELVKHGTPES